ncbi:protein THEM6-like isoform X2 [Cydia pomonella]|uniref:protein THEM6-like isoform X2 n=1 Tax=Cydia pomonella TaxID=82600 RepID=UPI002ADE6A11|nr:protein THEM6-like isoform X2 [Cydia pomonella]
MFFFLIKKYINMYSVLTAVALLFMIFDVSYYIRAIGVLLFGRLYPNKCKISETTFHYGICTTKDVDIFLTHMSNARFLRAVDFARQHFYDRTGIYSKLFKSTTFVKASTIRYRRPIALLSHYKVETRNYVVGVDLPTAMEEIPGADAFKTAPEEVTQWCQFLEASSARLRKKD